MLASLPKGFAPAKPMKYQDAIDEVKRIQDSGRLLVQLKHDGVCCFLATNEKGEVCVFTRQGRDITSAFATEDWPRLHPDIILIAEYVVKNTDGTESFEKALGVIKSGDQRSARLHKTYGGRFMVFDILRIAGSYCYRQPYADRYAAAFEVVAFATWQGNCAQLEIVHNLEATTIEEAFEEFGDSQLEGLIFRDVSAPTRLDFDGKARAFGSYKWKPMIEDDFIALQWRHGEGACANIVGSIDLARHNGTTIVECGAVGSGLTMKQRKEAMSWTYPCIIQVRFQEYSEDGRLRFPKFMRKRDDKTVDDWMIDRALEECVIALRTDNND